MKVTIDEIKLPAWKFRIWSHPIGVRRTILHASCVIESTDNPDTCLIEVLNIVDTNVISMKQVQLKLKDKVTYLGFANYTRNRSYGDKLITNKV